MAKILELMPEKEATQFRLSPATKARIARIAERTGKTRTEIVETAVVHFVATLESETPMIYYEVPSEVQNGHKSA